MLYYALGTSILYMPESYIMRAEPVYYTCRYSSLLHINYILWIVALTVYEEIYSFV